MIVAGVSLGLFLVAAGMIVVGGLTLWRPSRAADCPRHTRWAEFVAVVLA
jgi:hypothetical protein